MANWRRITYLSILVTAGLRGQSPASTERDSLPKTGCNQYTLQTIPVEGFGWKQRTCYWGKQLFTSEAVFGAAFFGGLAHLTKSPSEWPQGAEGYGQRVGTRYTQGMVKTTVDFLAGGLAGEDPRGNPPQIARILNYDRAGCRPPATVKGRIGQALLRPLWDSCEHRVAVGRIAGSFASGFIQLAWAPPSQNNLSNAFKGSGTAFGGYVTTSVFSEFGGDLVGWFGRKLAGDKKP